MTPRNFDTHIRIKPNAIIQSYLIKTHVDFKAAQKAYRILMRDNHPDKFNSLGDRKLTAEKVAYCVAINTAWEFVKDWLPQP